MLDRPGTFCPYSCTKRDGHAFLLRLARPQDRNCIIRNINEIGAENVLFPSNSYVPTPAWETALGADAGNGHTYLLVVAEIGKKVIGHGRLFPAGYNHKDGHVMDIGISVLKPNREFGVGTLLLRYLIDWARDSGFEKLTADVMSINHRALDLFFRFGFIVEGQRHNQFKIQNSYADQIFMSKFLC